MIVGSAVLVITAGVLLGVGLVRLDATLLYSSIGVSALAALTLAVGVRRAVTVRAGRGTIAVRPVVPAPRTPPPATGRATPRSVGRARVVAAPDGGDRTTAGDPSTVGDRPTVGDSPAVGDSTRASAGLDRSVVAGEPAPEVVGERDLARAARLTATVLVDQRPWFHRVDCTYLLGREAEPLTAAQAVERGILPCGHCRPVTTLLADTDTDPAAGGPGD